ncbi:MAG: gfo/Idh/MocA family oxidoreductase, partial [bacterium]|nr:gfo/Idh/MocA family oxidoreductase [bacterium]
GAPRKVLSKGPQHRTETFAADSDIRYEFAGTEHTTDTLTFRWTDGNGASRPDASLAQLPEGEKLPGAGSFLVGERGVMVIPHWSAPRLYSDGQNLDAALVEFPSKNHYHEWTDACRGVGQASCPFSYAAPLTEAVLVGTIAGRFQDRELAWNSSRLRFSDAQANALVRRTYRGDRAP